MTVTYFRDACWGWGYRVKQPQMLWESVGFKTKRGAMRDYRRSRSMFRSVKA